MVWNDLGVGSCFHEYLTNGGEAGWLTRLAGEMFPGSGDTGAFGCSSLHQPCLLARPFSCSELQASGHGAEFWILNAVQKLQADFIKAHENLQDTVINATLKVSSITKDFKVDMLQTGEALRWVYHLR